MSAFYHVTKRSCSIETRTHLEKDIPWSNHISWFDLIMRSDLMINDQISSGHLNVVMVSSMTSAFYSAKRKTTSWRNSREKVSKTFSASLSCMIQNIPGLFQCASSSWGRPFASHISGSCSFSCMIRGSQDETVSARQPISPPDPCYAAISYTAIAPTSYSPSSRHFPGAIWVTALHSPPQHYNRNEDASQTTPVTTSHHIATYSQQKAKYRYTKTHIHTYKPARRILGDKRAEVLLRA